MDTPAHLNITASGLQYRNRELARSQQSTRASTGTRRQCSGIFSDRQAARFRATLESIDWTPYVVSRQSQPRTRHARGVALTAHDLTSTIHRAIAPHHLDHQTERAALKAVIQKQIPGAVILIKSECSCGLVHTHSTILSPEPVDLDALHITIETHTRHRLILARKRHERAKLKTSNRRTIGTHNHIIRHIDSTLNNSRPLQSPVDVQALYFDGDIQAPIGWICYCSKPTDHIPQLRSYTCTPRISRRDPAEGEESAASPLPTKITKFDLRADEIEPFFNHLHNHSNPAIAEFAQRFDHDQATGFSIYATPQEIQELLTLLAAWREPAAQQARDPHRTTAQVMASPAPNPAEGGHQGGGTATTDKTRAGLPPSSTTHARAGP